MFVPYYQQMFPKMDFVSFHHLLNNKDTYIKFLTRFYHIPFSTDKRLYHKYEKKYKNSIHFVQINDIMVSCKLCEFMQKFIKESGARKWV